LVCQFVQGYQCSHREEKISLEKVTNYYLNDEGVERQLVIL